MKYIITLALAGIVLAAGISANSIHKKSERSWAHYQRNMREVTYPAWCKLHGRTDISYEEWSALWKLNLITSGDSK